MNPVATILLLAFVVVAVMWLQARWAEEERAAEDEGGGGSPQARATRELRRLASDDPEEVRQASNRLLSLGPGVIPALCDRLRAGDDANHVGEDPRGHQALVEDLVASFGLHAAPALAHSLRRVVFPSPMISAALRISQRVGPSTLQPLVTAIEEENVAGLGLVLHRCPGAPETHVLRTLPTLGPDQATRALRVFAGTLEPHAESVVELFGRAPAPLRRTMVRFFEGWPTPLAAEILVRAAHDPDPELRAAGVRGVALLAAEAPAPLREAVDDSNAAVRRAALMACGAVDPTAVQEALRHRVVDGPPGERVEAALALASSGGAADADTARALEKAADDEDPGVSLAALAALAVGGHQQGCAPAFAALDADTQDLRRIAARALCLLAPHDVRARERAFVLAEGDDPVTRAAACAGLVPCELRDLPRILARAVAQSAGDPVEHFHLRLAAQSLGEPALPDLLRLVRTARADAALLAAELVAATGTDAALEGLLRSLPHRRGDAVGMTIRSHAAAFGPIALEVASGLLRMGVGIIPTAICEFVLQYGDAEDHADALIEAIGLDDAHRAPALAALECFSATSPQAVLNALDRRRDAPGGDWVRARIGLQ